MRDIGIMKPSEINHNTVEKNICITFLCVTEVLLYKE